MGRRISNGPIAKTEARREWPAALSAGELRHEKGSACPAGVPRAPPPWTLTGRGRVRDRTHLLERLHGSDPGRERSAARDMVSTRGRTAGGEDLPKGRWRRARGELVSARSWLVLRQVIWHRLQQYPPRHESCAATKDAH